MEEEENKDDGKDDEVTEAKRLLKENPFAAVLTLSTAQFAGLTSDKRQMLLKFANNQRML